MLLQEGASSGDHLKAIGLHQNSKSAIVQIPFLCVFTQGRHLLLVYMYYTCLMLYYFCTLLVPKPLSTSIAVQGLQLHLEFILCDGIGTQWNWYYSRSGTHTDRS